MVARTQLLPARRILAAQIGIVAEIAAQPISPRGALLPTNHPEVVDLSIRAEDHVAGEAVALDHQHREEVVAEPAAINRAQNLTSIFYGI
jgi:SMC interacting uncharacterized protein involved in chromosome segregation